MLSYTKKCVNIISLNITCIFFFTFPILAKEAEKGLQYVHNKLAYQQEQMEKRKQEEQEREKRQEEKTRKQQIEKVKIGEILEQKHTEMAQIVEKSLQELPFVQEIKDKEEWTITIEKIGLYANIAEGTTDTVMNEYVGHFTETSIWDGNVALAAHNRGYPVNYFQDLKQLQNGDKILYSIGEEKREYEVDNIQIIEDTDLSCLEPTEENRITLITCVENEPSYRRCIQGIEIKQKGEEE